MKKRGVMFLVLRALARQFQHQADFLFRLVGDEAHTGSRPGAGAQSTVAAQQDAPQEQDLSESEIEAPPAHWLRRVQSAAPALLTGKEPVRRSRQQPALPGGQEDANARFRQFSGVDRPRPETEAGAPAGEHLAERSLTPPIMWSGDADHQRGPTQRQSGLNSGADRTVARSAQGDGLLPWPTILAPAGEWDPDAQRTIDGSESEDGGRLRFSHMGQPGAEPDQPLSDCATNQPARPVPDSLPAALPQRERKASSTSKPGAAASEIGSDVQPGTAAQRTLTRRPDTAWQRDVYGAEPDTSSVARPAEQDVGKASTGWQRHMQQSTPALLSRKEQVGHSVELVALTLPADGSAQASGAGRNVAGERAQRQSSGQADTYVLSSQQRWPDLQVGPDGISLRESEPGMSSPCTTSHAPWSEMSRSAAVSQSRALSLLDERMQPEVRWPSFAEEMMTRSQDWEMVQQIWRRQQRLDAEQRGSLWNA